jgi:hypothetical protein
MLHCSIANASRQAHSEAESKVPVGSQEFVALLVFSQSLPTGKGVFEKTSKRTNGKNYRGYFVGK